MRLDISTKIKIKLEISQRSFPDISCLLLYDLRNDPYALHNINDERPDIVEKHTQFQENKWRENRILAKRFMRSEEGALTSEQLWTLHSLGYIR